MTAILATLVVGAQVVTGGVPSRATTPSRLEIVIYSDFQCRFCRQFALPTRDIRSHGLSGVPVTVTFKHFPLAFHADAPLAHQAAEAARAQGRFWEMHDLLFTNQAQLRRADLLGYARALGLDLARFEQDLDSSATKQAIAADLAEGTKAGITGTPSYVINGRVYRGTRTVAQLAGLVESAQPRDRARPAAPLTTTEDHRPDPVDEHSAMRRPGEITDAMVSIGPERAAVTIELFADLQSPISLAALEAVEQARGRFPAAVRVQFRSYPLAFHPEALLAHEAAMAAAGWGKFWEFTRALLARGGSVREDDLTGIARAIGLNDVELRDALRQHRYLPQVEWDRDEASRRGVRGSPTVIVNGKRIDGVPSVHALASSINQSLVEARDSGSAIKTDK
jgi:protein-disulfide isomerase